MILRRRGIAPRAFRKACREALRASGEKGPISARMQIAAALAAAPGGRLCDAGGNISIYPAVARMLGADVTVIDMLPGYDTDTAMRGAVERLERAGIRFIRGDIADIDIGREQFDTVCAFETIEHFPHSPKPVLEKLVAALKPGGRLCLSVPNVVRFEMRLRALHGRSPHERIENFYNNGSPFLGHHREYTKDEVAFLAKSLGLDIVQLFGLNITYESRKKKTLLQRALVYCEESWAVGDRLMPDTLRHHIWLEARKPGER